MHADRNEHLAWCKNKALAEIGEGTPTLIRNALDTFIAELIKHPDTQHHIAITTGTLMLAGDMLTTKAEMEEFINSFGR